MKMIPYGRQDISEDDIRAVEEVLRSDFLTQGPSVPLFEKSVIDLVGAKYAIAANSATSALHMAYAALGVNAGDMVWTSPITFVATANAALHCGAMAHFVDIDPDTLCMDADKLESRLVKANRDNDLPKVISVVHMAGQSADMDAIGYLAKKYGVRVVEDASHAIGGRWKEDPVGSCKNSDITVFSFHPVKIITTAEGGMATTNDPHLAQQMELIRSHGVTRNESLMIGPSEGPWYYQQVSLGWNYRMTDIQAALGVSQIKRLDTFLKRRHEISDFYDTALKGLPLDIPETDTRAYSSLHLYIIRLHDANKRRSVFEYLRENGIGVNVHYIPVHLQPFWREAGFSAGMYPVAEDYYSRAISIPIHPGMTPGEQERVIYYLKKATK